MNNSPVFFDPTFRPIDVPQAHSLWKWKSIWGISPKMSLDVLPKIYKKFGPIDGLIVLDFYAPDLEWEWIRKIDIELSQITLPCAVDHVTMGQVEPMINPRKWQPIAAELETYQKLASDLNAEVWMLFAKKIDHEARTVLQNMSFDATDEYTLEGELSSFHQEANSYLLSERLKTVENLKKEMGALKLDDSQTFQLEKEIVRARRALGHNVEDLGSIIDDALYTIDAIRENRTEWGKLETLLKALKDLCASQTSIEKKQEALGRLLEYFSLGLVIIGDWDHKEVQNFLHRISLL